MTAFNWDLLTQEHFLRYFFCRYKKSRRAARADGAMLLWHGCTWDTKKKASQQKNSLRLRGKPRTASLNSFCCNIVRLRRGLFLFLYNKNIVIKIKISDILEHSCWRCTSASESDGRGAKRTEVPIGTRYERIANPEQRDPERSNGEAHLWCACRCERAGLAQNNETKHKQELLLGVAKLVKTLRDTF